MTGKPELLRHGRMGQVCHDHARDAVMYRAVMLSHVVQQVVALIALAFAMADHNDARIARNIPGNGVKEVMIGGKAFLAVAVMLLAVAGMEQTVDFPWCVTGAIKRQIVNPRAGMIDDNGNRSAVGGQRCRVHLLWRPPCAGQSVAHGHHLIGRQILVMRRLEGQMIGAELQHQFAAMAVFDLTRGLKNCNHVAPRQVVRQRVLKDAVKHTRLTACQVRFGGGRAGIVMRHDLAFRARRLGQTSGRVLERQDRGRGLGVAGSETTQTARSDGWVVSDPAGRQITGANLGRSRHFRHPEDRRDPCPCAPEVTAMSDDKELKQSVLDELNWEPSVNAAHIGVTTKDGIVTLTGSVESFAEKHGAETAALRVKDVKAVAEEIEVKLPFSVKHGDSEIAAAAANRLAWDSSVPKDAVKVAVSKGWITLTGDVHWRYQHDAAADSVRTLWGVIGVSNEIAITPQANAGNIRADIMGALKRSWFTPETIDVVANDGKVTLTGTVEYWDERALAGTTAWAAPGVTSVANDIRVH